MSSPHSAEYVVFICDIRKENQYMIPYSSNSESSAPTPFTPHFTSPSVSLILLGIAVIVAALQPLQLQAQTSSSAADLQVLSTSIASDSNNNIYYADTAHSAIWKVSSAGATTSVNCCTGISGLSQPRGVAVDSDDNLYIADTGNNRIVEVNETQQVSVVDTGLYQLSRPSGVGIDSAGDLYIADTGNNRILEVIAGGQMAVVETGAYHLAGPTSVAVDEHSTLYISDNGNNRIVMIPASGSPAVLFANQLDAPLSIVTSTDGSAYIAQTGTSIRSSSANGSVEMPAVVASFSATNVNIDTGSGKASSIGKMNVTLTALNGFNDTLYLSVLGLPPNVEMQLSHPIVTFNGASSITESLQVGIAQSVQVSSLRRFFNRVRYHEPLQRAMVLAGMAPISLLFLIGLRLSGTLSGGASKILGILALLVLLPATVAMTSGCAGGYPAGLFGSATYTATMTARTASGTTYPIGSFGITVQ